MANAPVWRRVLPAGDHGTRITLDAMRRVARHGAASPEVRGLAAHVFQDAGPGPARWLALRMWIARRWRFVSDPPRQETVVTPREQLRRYHTTGDLSGDCDDAAVLAAALALAGGIPARYVVLAFDGGPFRHVFTEVRANSAWHEVDVTRTRQTLPRRVTRVWTVEV